jgi:hypothetical protein
MADHAGQSHAIRIATIQFREDGSMTALTQSYTLECNDVALDAQFRAWIEGSRLEWPGHLDLSLDIVDELPVRDDNREALPQPGILIQAGPPHGTVRVQWTTYGAEGIVHETRPEARMLMTRAAVENFEEGERGFLLVVLLFALRRVGWYHIHGAALVDPAGRGWLLVGHAKSGKSTTSALLARNGWSVTTDDIGFAAKTDDDVRLHGYFCPIGLREGGYALLGATGGIDFARRGKMGFYPQDLGGSWVPTVQPEILLFPSVGEKTSVEPLGARQAMNALIDSSIWVLFETTHAQEHLDALSRLVKQSRCFKATLGPDLFDNPALLQELVS